MCNFSLLHFNEYIVRALGVIFNVVVYHVTIVVNGHRSFEEIWTFLNKTIGNYSKVTNLLQTKIILQYLLDK